MPYIIKKGQYIEVDSEGHLLFTKNTENTQPDKQTEKDIRYSKKLWLFLFSVIVGSFLLFCMNFHIISSDYETTFVPKVKLTLDETFVDYEEIFGPPRLIVMLRNPLTYLALQKEGYIK